MHRNPIDQIAAFIVLAITVIALAVFGYGNCQQAAVLRARCTDTVGKP